MTRLPVTGKGAGNGERGTGCGERGTGSGERGARNGERGAGNEEQTDERLAALPSQPFVWGSFDLSRPSTNSTGARAVPFLSHTCWTPWRLPSLKFSMLSS